MAAETILQATSTVLQLQTSEMIERDASRTHDLNTLDRAMGWARLNEDYGTVVGQLSDPVDLSANGLVLTLDKRAKSTKLAETGLPSLLSQIWERLEDQNFVLLCKDWAANKISTGEVEDCLLFLRTLANFSYLFNSQLETHKDNPLEHPLSSLAQITEHAQSFIPNEQGDAIGVLIETNLAINTRIQSYLLTNGHSTSERPASLAVVEEHLSSWLFANLYQHDVSFTNLAESAVSYLQAAGFADQEVRASLDNLAARKIIPDEVIEQIRHHAITVNLIVGNRDEIAEVQQRTIESLEKNPFIDAMERDYAEFIPPSANIIRVYVATGTFHAHNGHAELVRKVSRFIDNHTKNEKYSNNDDEAFEFILLLPNIIPGIGVNKEPKDFATSGTVEDRVSVLLAHLSGLSRDRVLISTKQLHPSQSLRGRDRVTSFLNQLNDKIYCDYQNAERKANYRFEVVRFTGADELAWDGDTLQDEQNPRYTTYANRGIIVARHGLVIRCLGHANQIVERTNCDLIVLDDPFSAISSSQALETLHSTGSREYFTPGAWPLLEEYTKEAIAQRKERGCDIGTINIPSVTEINKRTVKKLKERTGVNSV